LFSKLFNRREYSFYGDDDDFHEKTEKIIKQFIERHNVDDYMCVPRDMDADIYKERLERVCPRFLVEEYDKTSSFSEPIYDYVMEGIKLHLGISNSNRLLSLYDFIRGMMMLFYDFDFVKTNIAFIVARNEFIKNSVSNITFYPEILEAFGYYDAETVAVSEHFSSISYGIFEEINCYVELYDKYLYFDDENDE
jgi:hypothetical protein